MKRILYTCVALALLMSCDGGGGGETGPGEDTTPAPTYDTVPGLDTTVPGVDGVEPREDVVTLLPDVPPGIDAEPGSLELGEECSLDLQCSSGLCFRVAGMSGCTLPCQAQTECQAVGLVCVALRPGIQACVPPPASANATCADHGGCDYPLICREDTGWCTLPECTWDGDCPLGEECEPGTRRCQPTACVSTYECEHPLEVCAGGTCGAPTCTKSSDCAQGQFCHPTQLQCQEAEPCNDEGACDVYNQACVDGLCIPNLCLAPCNTAGEKCNPATGLCGKPCAGHGDCPTGAACAIEAGVCYPNLPPLAQVVAAVAAQAGSPVVLDGANSVDPEGEPLTWSWTVNAAPPGSQHLATPTLPCPAATCQFTPDMSGQYLVGLRISDPAGALSAQAQIGIWVE